MKDYNELPPVEGLKGNYMAAIDASSLTGRDRFTFGIAHRQSVGPSSQDGTGSVVDLLRGWSRAPVAIVCDEIAAICSRYGITSVDADQFGAEFLSELLAQRGISLNKRPFTSSSKQEIFITLKRMLAGGKLRLLDHEKSLRELRQLEAKKLSGGGYAISAPRSEHDDFATVIALLVSGTGKIWIDFISSGPERGWTQIAPRRGIGSRQ
jgi:hypothetical protein